MSKRSQQSKYLSCLLRHSPGDLAMDAAGWVKVSDLLSSTNWSLEELNEIVDASSKQRFAFSACFNYIRASQGHSIPVDLGLYPVQPHSYLYHGTSSLAAIEIVRTGIQKMQRNHVHLSADKATAHEVGSRHSSAVAILTVASQRMHEMGYRFYRSDNGVWLTDHVPPEFLYATEHHFKD